MSKFVRFSDSALKSLTVNLISVHDSICLSVSLCVCLCVCVCVLKSENGESNDTPLPCIHIHLCVCAFLSSAKLTSEFRNLLEHTLKCMWCAVVQVFSIFKLNSTNYGCWFDLLHLQVVMTDKQPCTTDKRLCPFFCIGSQAMSTLIVSWRVSLWFCHSVCLVVIRWYFNTVFSYMHCLSVFTDSWFGPCKVSYNMKGMKRQGINIRVWTVITHKQEIKI